MKKIIPFLIILIMAAAGAAFLGGVKYGQNKIKSSRLGLQSMGGGLRGGRQGGPSTGGFINGEILSKDEKSLTVKLRDGGSKIIFFSTSTEVGKFVQGTAADLVAGKSVMAAGKANSDGSITAQSIQIRPKGAAPVGEIKSDQP